MIYSMTAYAESDIHATWGFARFEIKSVNHRYLELNFKLPEGLRDLELSLRDIARRLLGRGKIECVLRFLELPGETKALNVDYNLVKHLIDLCHPIQELLGEKSAISPLEILKWPYVIKSPELKSEALQKEIILGFKEAIDNLLKNRAEEGFALQALINERLEKMSLLLRKIRERVPKVIHSHREKLLTKIRSLSLELDETRLEQEIFYMTAKIDIEEELDRFATHLKATEDTMMSHEPVGRRLDFLMQELNREANTIASKSIDAEITESAIELKVFIEQIREQIQNLV